MINNVNLKHFKCFENHSFEFAPFTIFCGSNSSGKSTVIQSILGVLQNYNNLRENKFALDGDYFNFGKFKDILSYGAKNNNVVLGIDDFNLTLNGKNLDEKVCELEKDCLTGFNFLEKIKKNDFVYLCAERFGPRKSFELGMNSDRLDVGIYGQFAISCYQFNFDKPVNNQLFAKKICSHLISSDEDEGKIIFTDALVREAMRKICPDFTLSVACSEEMERVYNSYPMGSLKVRPVNVGFGVSYVLPLIIAAALIKEGGVLIVENPEVHLHPSAQSALVKILYELSMSGVQVIIETHSDHIINGARVFAKEKKPGIGSNVIHSISKKSSGRAVVAIHIDDDGNLTDSDDNFFDQINKDLMELF